MRNTNLHFFLPRMNTSFFLAQDGKFEEGKHPRAENGKFGSGGGGGSKYVKPRLAKTQSGKEVDLNKTEKVAGGTRGYIMSGKHAVRTFIPDKEHPQAENGKFGSGGGGSKQKISQRAQNRAEKYDRDDASPRKREPSRSDEAEAKRLILKQMQGEDSDPIREFLSSKLSQDDLAAFDAIGAKGA